MLLHWASLQIVELSRSTMASQTTRTDALVRVVERFVASSVMQAIS